MKRKTLSKKEIKELNEKLQKYNFQFDKKENVEVVEEDKYTIIKSDNAVMFFYLNNEIIPSLKSVLKEKIDLKKITVDMGAVKFVVNGADIMRPGIVGIENGIENGEIIEIIDINNKKPLAVGRSLFNSKEIENMLGGKVVLNLHYIGDRIWQA